jgi:hypothetical protein
VRRFPFEGFHCGAPIVLGIVSLFLVAHFGFPCFLLFIFDLLYKRISSSPSSVDRWVFSRILHVCFVIMLDKSGINVGPLVFF